MTLLFLSSMQVPPWCLRHLFWPELRPGLFIGHDLGAWVFGEVEAVHVQFEVNILHYRGAWR